VERELHVFFSGHVQGVGFRYYTLQIMAGYPVRGYVRNLRDGRVELLLQGEEKDLLEALEAVRRRMASYISSVEMNWREPAERLRGFEIRR